MPPRKRLGQLLTELGVIDEHQLQSALGHQKQWGGKLGAVLVQKGFCKEPDVVVALSRHLGMPAVKLLEAKVDPRAVSFVSKQIAEKLHVFPYDVSGTGRSEVVTIAMSDPTDLSAVDQLAFHTGKRIKPMLAGDSEIVHAIQQHYGGGEEKDKAAAAAKAAAPGAAAAKAMAQAAPAAKAAAPAAPAATPVFSRRVEPPIQSMPTPPGGSTRVAPYIPPPIPAAPPKPAPKLEEIAPDVEEMAAAAAAPPQEPLEIPEDDGQMMGLEPIAAHSQFGEEVAGAEEVAGEGSAADSMEGLESASLPHGSAETAQQMEGLEPAAAHSQEPTPEGGWGQDSAGSWDAAPTGEEAAPPSGDFGSANDWSSEEAAAGGEQGWGEQAKAKDTTGEELPVDAILGEASTEQPPQEQSEPPPPEEAQHKEPAVAEPAAAEAEAPDAWASSEDPLATQAERQPAETSWSESAPAEEAPPAEAAAETPPAEAAAETAAESVTAETEAPPEWGETEEPPAVQEAAPEAPPEQPAEEKAPEEELADEYQAQPAAEEQQAQPAAEQPAAEEPAEESAAEFEIPPEEFSEEQGEMKIEGWVAPPREPEPQGAGWLGEALEATTPLSPADVGTLSSVGVDPNDGVAALRALAAILRVLNRRQMLEVDEIANEIRASREQGAAYAAQQAGLANGPPAAETAATEEAAPATEPAET
jgi:hypothetical protein